MQRKMQTCLATFMVIMQVTFCSMATAADAVPEADNPELQALFDTDQAARSMNIEEIDWDTVNRDDIKRRARVREIVQAGDVRTARDYFNAAMVFQHGATIDQARIAFGLAQTALLMEPENKRYGWLAAAALDRMLMRARQPQWYGTQFWRPSQDEDWELYPLAEDVISEEERRAAGVADLDTQRDRVRKMNENLKRHEKPD